MDGPTRNTPWPFGPRSLRGLPVREWPMTHILAQLHLAAHFHEVVPDDKQEWLEVLALEAHDRHAAERDADLRLLPDCITEGEDWPI